jgi:hypothetical protein
VPTKIEWKDETILIRLLRKQPDGSFKIVGYEKHENGVIYHCDIVRVHQAGDLTKPILNNLCWRDILDITCHNTLNYIKHDRKDPYTGIEIAGVKLFQRDEAKITFTDWQNDYYNQSLVGTVKIDLINGLYLVNLIPPDHELHRDEIETDGDGNSYIAGCTCEPQKSYPIKKPFRKKEAMMCYPLFGEPEGVELESYFDIKIIGTEGVER